MRVYESPNSDEAHVCNICLRSYATKKSLGCHIRAHTYRARKEALNQARQDGLIDILTISHGESPSFVCLECNQSFPKKNALNGHMNKHSQRKRPKNGVRCATTLAIREPTDATMVPNLSHQLVARDHRRIRLGKAPMVGSKSESRTNALWNEKKRKAMEPDLVEGSGNARAICKKKLCLDCAGEGLKRKGKVMAGALVLHNEDSATTSNSYQEIVGMSNKETGPLDFDLNNFPPGWDDEACQGK